MTDDGSDASWRIVRYIEEPMEVADLNRYWRHPAGGKPDLVRYAVELEGERRVWGLKTRDAALRWLARLTAPVQLEAPLWEVDSDAGLDDDDGADPEIAAGTDLRAA
jgi:hypothetical protein